jgi:thiamine-monophosphate kinase
MQPFTHRKAESVGALGEERLIESIRTWLGRSSPPAPHGIGDDCAVLPPSLQPQLVTVDPVLFGRHFDASIPPSAVGEKLLKRNLSDIAAMGGRPRAAVVSLALDAKTRTAWLESFYRGIAAAARRYGVAIVGGDVAEAPGTLVASLTLIGEAAASRVLTRAGAALGDWIYVTGELGNSLRSGHHLTFSPRLDAGVWLAAQPVVKSMMDVSDGLAKDLHALTPRGSIAALDPASLPCRLGADVRAAVADGEDYELVFTLDAAANRDAFVRAWQRQFPRLRLSCVGQFVRAGKLPAGALNLEDFRGYEHLR